MAVERIDYQAGSVKAKGALVWNEKISGKRPLLLVMPNWLGVTDIASITTYVVAADDLNDRLAVVMAVRDEVMNGHRAASTLVTVPALARAEWQVEISLVAAQ